MKYVIWAVRFWYAGWMIPAGLEHFYHIYPQPGSNSSHPLAAQMLEANPKLTPSGIKRILISTAERLPHYEVDRQGWGVIDARRAVAMALESAPQSTD